MRLLHLDMIRQRSSSTCLRRGALSTRWGFCLHSRFSSSHLWCPLIHSHLSSLSFCGLILASRRSITCELISARDQKESINGEWFLTPSLKFLTCKEKANTTTTARSGTLLTVSSLLDDNHHWVVGFRDWFCDFGLTLDSERYQKLWERLILQWKTLHFGTDFCEMKKMFVFVF